MNGRRPRCGCNNEKCHQETTYWSEKFNEWKRWHTHTHMRTHAHRYAYTATQTHVNANARIWMQKLTYTCWLIHLLLHPYTDMHINIQTLTRAHTYLYIYKYTHLIVRVHTQRMQAYIYISHIQTHVKQHWNNYICLCVWYDEQAETRRPLSTVLL